MSHDNPQSLRARCRARVWGSRTGGRSHQSQIFFTLWPICSPQKEMRNTCHLMTSPCGEGTLTSGAAACTPLAAQPLSVLSLIPPTRVPTSFLRGRNGKFTVKSIPDPKPRPGTFLVIFGQVERPKPEPHVHVPSASSTSNCKRASLAWPIPGTVCALGWWLCC